MENQSISELSINRVNPCDVDFVAQTLAAAYIEDPVLVWAMPKEATRQADAEIFFRFLLKRERSHRREIFATSDCSAVAVITQVDQEDQTAKGDPFSLRLLQREESPVAKYFRWIETFRPDIPHYYLEFIGCLKTQRSKGVGSFLLESLLKKSDTEGRTFWCWSSNPRNLTFYRRLGFNVCEKLYRDSATPAVTSLIRLPVVARSLKTQ